MTSDEALALFQQPHILWTSTDDLNALIGRLHLAGRVLAAEVRRLREVCTTIHKRATNNSVLARNLDRDLAAARAEAMRLRVALESITKEYLGPARGER